MRNSVETLTSFKIFIWATIFGIQYIPSKFDQQTSVQVTRQLQNPCYSVSNWIHWSMSMAGQSFLIWHPYSECCKRVCVVKNFLYYSTEHLACMLFKSFIMSLTKKCMSPSSLSRYVSLWQGRHFGKFLNATSLDSLVNKHTKSRIVQIYMDDKHFMQKLFERCPSGRLRHP